MIEKINKKKDISIMNEYGQRFEIVKRIRRRKGTKEKLISDVGTIKSERRKKKKRKRLVNHRKKKRRSEKGVSGNWKITSWKSERSINSDNAS